MGSGIHDICRRRTSEQSRAEQITVAHCDNRNVPGKAREGPSPSTGHACGAKETPPRPKCRNQGIPSNNDTSFGLTTLSLRSPCMQVSRASMTPPPPGRYLIHATQMLRLGGVIGTASVLGVVLPRTSDAVEDLLGPSWPDTASDREAWRRAGTCVKAATARWRPRRRCQSSVS